jgi:hypothetical protein
MILGLDISTSTTGWAIIETDGSLIDQGYISTGKISGLFEKAKKVGSKISKINIDYDIEKIYIEENLQSFRSGFSSAQTISTLAKFNGIVSYICFTEFGFEPAFLNVNSARKSLGIKIQREKVCGISTKDQVFAWVRSDLKDSGYVWPVKTLKSGPRKGETIFINECFDISDAYVIGLSGFRVNN